MKNLVEHIVKGYLLKEKLSRFVFHYTTMANFMDICRHDEILLTNKYRDDREEFNFKEMYYLSLTRTFDYRGGYPGFMGVNPIDGFNIRIWFDGDLLNQSFRGKPVDFFRDSYLNKHKIFQKNWDNGTKIPKYHDSIETEDRLLSNKPIIEHVHKYIIRIDVLVDPTHDGMMSKLHTLINTPFWDLLYFYDNTKDFNDKLSFNINLKDYIYNYVSKSVNVNCPSKRYQKRDYLLDYFFKWIYIIEQVSTEQREEYILPLLKKFHIEDLKEYALSAKGCDTSSKWDNENKGYAILSDFVRQMDRDSAVKITPLLQYILKKHGINNVKKWRNGEYQ